MSQQLSCIPKLWIAILEYALTLAPLASLLSSCRLNDEEGIDIDKNHSFPLNSVGCSLHIPKGISDIALYVYRHSFYLVLIAGISVVQTYVRRNAHYSIVAFIRVALKLKYFMICTFIFIIVFELWSEHYLFWSITSLAENILFFNLIDKLEKGISTDAVKIMRKLKELSIICRLFPSFGSHIRTAQHTLIGTLKQYPRILPSILISIFMWHLRSLSEYSWRYNTSGDNSVQLTLIVGFYNTLFVIYALWVLRSLYIRPQNSYASIFEFTRRSFQLPWNRSSHSLRSGEPGSVIRTLLDWYNVLHTGAPTVICCLGIIQALIFLRRLFNQEIEDAEIQSSPPRSKTRRSSKPPGSYKHHKRTDKRLPKRRRDSITPLSDGPDEDQNRPKIATNAGFSRNWSTTMYWLYIKNCICGTIVEILGLFGVMGLLVAKQPGQKLRALKMWLHEKFFPSQSHEKGCEMSSSEHISIIQLLYQLITEMMQFTSAVFIGILRFGLVGFMTFLGLCASIVGFLWGGTVRILEVEVQLVLGSLATVWWVTMWIWFLIFSICGSVGSGIARGFGNRRTPSPLSVSSLISLLPTFDDPNPDLSDSRHNTGRNYYSYSDADDTSEYGYRDYGDDYSEGDNGDDPPDSVRIYDSRDAAKLLTEGIITPPPSPEEWPTPRIYSTQNRAQERQPSPPFTERQIPISNSRDRSEDDIRASSGPAHTIPGSFNWKRPSSPESRASSIVKPSGEVRPSPFTIREPFTPVADEESTYDFITRGIYENYDYGSIIGHTGEDSDEESTPNINEEFDIRRADSTEPTGFPQPVSSPVVSWKDPGPSEPSGSESSVENTPTPNSQAKISQLRETFQKFRHLFRISPIEDGNAQEQTNQLAILGSRSVSVASGRGGLWNDPPSRQSPQLTRRPQLPNHARVPWRNLNQQQPIATPVTELERMERDARGAQDTSHLAWRYRPENVLAAETLTQREWARLYNPTTGPTPMWKAEWRAQNAQNTNVTHIGPRSDLPPLMFMPQEALDELSRHQKEYLAREEQKKERLNIFRFKRRMALERNEVQSPVELGLRRFMGDLMADDEIIRVAQRIGNGEWLTDAAHRMQQPENERPEVHVVPRMEPSISPMTLPQHPQSIPEPVAVAINSVANHQPARPAPIELPTPSNALNPFALAMANLQQPQSVTQPVQTYGTDTTLPHAATLNQVQKPTRNNEPNANENQSRYPFLPAYMQLDSQQQSQKRLEGNDMDIDHPLQIPSQQNPAYLEGGMDVDVVEPTTENPQRFAATSQNMEIDSHSNNQNMSNALSRRDSTSSCFAPVSEQLSKPRYMSELIWLSWHNLLTPEKYQELMSKLPKRTPESDAEIAKRSELTRILSLRIAHSLDGAYIPPPMSPDSDDDEAGAPKVFQSTSQTISQESVRAAPQGPTPLSRPAFQRANQPAAQLAAQVVRRANQSVTQSTVQVASQGASEFALQSPTLSPFRRAANTAAMRPSRAAFLSALERSQRFVTRTENTSSSRVASQPPMVPSTDVSMNDAGRKSNMTIQTQESNQRLQIEPLQEQQQRQRNAYGAVTAHLSRLREEAPPIRTVQPLCGNPILSNEPSSSERASGPGHVPGLGRITRRKSRTSKRGLQSNGMDSDSEDDDVDDGSESD